MMKRPPVLTEDGLLLLKEGEELSVDENLGVPRLEAIMRLEETSDTLRGILRDLISEGTLQARCFLIGRSGHSQVGLDVDFAASAPEIDTNRRRVDVPVVLTSLNGNVHDKLLAELVKMVAGGKNLTVGRLFIPMCAPLDKQEIEKAVEQHHLLLPPKAEVGEDGGIAIPLDNFRYLLSTTLFTTGQNAEIVLTHGKEGLSLIQHPSYRGLPPLLHPGDFLVGAIRISLGPYLALFDRQLNENGVFHLAARLLDAVRTTGIRVPRQVEVFNAGNSPVDPRNLKVRMQLYPADPATARVAARVFGSGRAEKIIRNGVDFADATDIFNLSVCEALFDNLSSSPSERGNYSRVVTRNKVVEIQRELEEGEWHEGAQNRIVYEVVRGRITSGVHRGDQITPDLRGFVDRLETVGGSQDLRNVYVSNEFPVTDTLRVLKRNNVGVFVGRSIRASEIVNHSPLLHRRNGSPNIYFSQTTYETFCDLSEHDAVRFYMIFDEEGQNPHVREFHRGFWTTREGKERLTEVHTIIAMFGSHVDGAEDILTEQIHLFLRKMNEMPEMTGKFAICHGSGPGVMRIADEAAKSQGVLRIGVGIDSEKIGQKPNLSPPVMVNFMNSARHMRQNILDRTSLFKIYNIGGVGTFEEILIAITNLKLFESLPAPHIFIDPFGLGEKSSHLWELAMRQLRTLSSLKNISQHAVHLTPSWVPNFCHVVKDYADALTIIERFVRDPIAYWEKAGIQDHDLVRACENATRARVIIPPYIEKAVQAIQGGCEIPG